MAQRIEPPKLPIWPIPEGTELELATRLLRELHPKHDLAWHSVCIMCAQIEALESTLIDKERR